MPKITTKMQQCEPQPSRRRLYKPIGLDRLASAPCGYIESPTFRKTAEAKAWRWRAYSQARKLGLRVRVREYYTANGRTSFRVELVQDE